MFRLPYSGGSGPPLDRGPKRDPSSSAGFWTTSRSGRPPCRQTIAGLCPERPGFPLSAPGAVLALEAWLSPNTSTMSHTSSTSLDGKSWKVLGKCLAGAWQVLGRCLASAWQVLCRHGKVLVFALQAPCRDRKVLVFVSQQALVFAQHWKTLVFVSQVLCHAPQASAGPCLQSENCPGGRLRESKPLGARAGNCLSARGLARSRSGPEPHAATWDPFLGHDLGVAQNPHYMVTETLVALTRNAP